MKDKVEKELIRYTMGKNRRGFVVRINVSGRKRDNYTSPRLFPSTAIPDSHGIRSLLLRLLLHTSVSLFSSNYRNRRRQRRRRREPIENFIAVTFYIRGYTRQTFPELISARELACTSGKTNWKFQVNQQPRLKPA